MTVKKHSLKSEYNFDLNDIFAHLQKKQRYIYLKRYTYDSHPLYIAYMCKIIFTLYNTT